MQRNATQHLVEHCELGLSLQIFRAKCFNFSSSCNLTRKFCDLEIFTRHSNVIGCIRPQFSDQRREMTTNLHPAARFVFPISITALCIVCGLDTYELLLGIEVGEGFANVTLFHCHHYIQM